ncbi:MAG: hypothetical protein RJA70_2176, partial [Pseudomonadota bacterium]
MHLQMMLPQMMLPQMMLPQMMLPQMMLPQMMLLTILEVRVRLVALVLGLILVSRLRPESAATLSGKSSHPTLRGTATFRRRLWIKSPPPSSTT